MEPGTKISVEDERAIIETIYDIILPKKSKYIQMYDNPFYVTRKDNRPDICINVYSKQSGWYIGSFVIECKYRSFKSFWRGKTWSGQERIKAYHVVYK